ncbi:hypothetical protein B0H11DRAFT_1906241 [Mycena galericulata]|nr:hypothetical protein B0H11DRAFT_1906241 [Mycena galericulata]
MGRQTSTTPLVAQRVRASRRGQQRDRPDSNPVTTRWRNNSPGAASCRGSKSPNGGAECEREGRTARQRRDARQHGQRSADAGASVGSQVDGRGRRAQRGETYHRVCLRMRGRGHEHLPVPTDLDATSSGSAGGVAKAAGRGGLPSACRRAGVRAGCLVHSPSAFAGPESCTNQQSRLRGRGSCAALTAPLPRWASAAQHSGGGVGGCVGGPTGLAADEDSTQSRGSGEFDREDARGLGTRGTYDERGDEILMTRKEH